MSRFVQMVLGILGVGALLYFGKFVLIIVCSSLFLSFVLSPLVRRLERWRLPRAGAALIAVLLLLIAGGGVGALAWGRAAAFAEQLPRNAKQIRAHLRGLTERADAIQKSTASALPSTSDPPLRVAEQPGWNDVMTQLGALGELLFAVTFVPFLVFFMLTGHDHARAASIGLLPLEDRQRAGDTIDRIVAIIRRFVVGNLLLGLALGVLSVAVLFFFDVPFFYFVGFICGYLTLVPYLGGFLSPLLPMLLSVGKLDGSHLMLMGSSMLSIHLFTINVVYPKIIGGTLKLNALTSTLALLLWGWLWGPIGLLFALPLTAGLKAICDHIEPLQPYGMWLGEESSVAEIRAATTR